MDLEEMCSKREKSIEEEIKINVRNIQRLERQGMSEEKIRIIRQNTTDPSQWRNQEEKDIYNEYFMEQWGDEIFFKNSLGLYCLLHIL